MLVPVMRRGLVVCASRIRLTREGAEAGRGRRAGGGLAADAASRQSDERSPVMGSGGDLR
jgi:hypothetical protein